MFSCRCRAVVPIGLHGGGKPAPRFRVVAKLLQTTVASGAENGLELASLVGSETVSKVATFMVAEKGGWECSG